MRRTDEGELVIEERERQAITELVSDLTTLWNALVPLFASVGSSVQGAVAEDRRRDNIGIIKSMAEELSY